MKKIILILFLTTAVTNLIAQIKKTEVDSSTAKVFPIEMLTKIELKSLLGAAPIFFDNKIYTVEKSGFISCFDSTGNVVWKHSVSSAIISRPIVADGQIAIGTTDGEIITLVGLTGEQIQ